MDSLFTILSDRLPDEPPEIKIVKQYIREHFRENALVAADKTSITVTVRSSALAGTLRTRTSAIGKELEKALGKSSSGSAKRLIFRIGQV
jgi:hypothetical protein